MKKQILKTLEAYLANLYEWQNDEEVREDIESTKAQIEYLKAEIRKEAEERYKTELSDFLAHLGDTFGEMMCDNATSETITEFYNMDFTITWNEKTVKIYNGAEVFQGIEDVIQTEIDNI